MKMSPSTLPAHLGADLNYYKSRKARLVFKRFFTLSLIIHSCFIGLIQRVQQDIELIINLEADSSTREFSYLQKKPLIRIHDMSKDC